MLALKDRRTRLRTQLVANAHGFPTYRPPASISGSLVRVVDEIIELT
jgi:hypothetical protein